MVPICGFEMFLITYLHDTKCAIINVYIEPLLVEVYILHWTKVNKVDLNWNIFLKVLDSY